VKIAGEKKKINTESTEEEENTEKKRERETKESRNSGKKMAWCLRCTEVAVQRGTLKSLRCRPEGRRYICRTLWSISKPKFKIGDKVKVIGLPVTTYAPGVKDELGTEELFRSMLGKVYTVRGFDETGHIELHPTRLD
jgi:hypothetical protein